MSIFTFPRRFFSKLGNCDFNWSNVNGRNPNHYFYPLCSFVYRCLYYGEIHQVGRLKGRLYGKHLHLLWCYHPGGLTGLPNLSEAVAHFLKSQIEIPTGFFRTQATVSRTKDKPTSPPAQWLRISRNSPYQSVVLKYLATIVAVALDLSAPVLT